jgi:hypothetical protein
MDDGRTHSEVWSIESAQRSAPGFDAYWAAEWRKRR